MNASRPEAETEYSSGRRPICGLGLLGAALLLVAEFTPLLRIETVARHPVLVRTIATGPHHAWALVPIAVLAALLALMARRSSTGRIGAALAVLGIAALAVALISDLPSVHDAGIVGSTRSGLHEAQAHAAVGLYLETLGAVVLLLAGAAGALARGRAVALLTSRPVTTQPQQTRR